MSEPLTEQDLAAIEAEALKNPHLAVCRNDVPALLAEVRQLRKCRQEEWCPGVPVACQKHVDQAAVELQDLRAWKHNATQQLLERSHQAEELLADRERAIAALERLRASATCEREAKDVAIQERDELRAQVAELRALLSEAPGTGLVTENPWVLKAQAALARTPSYARLLQEARREVVEAATEFMDCEEGGMCRTHMEPLQEAVEALKRLEERS